ncbi:ABC transporter permease, partial [Glutamicibacter creatinolyticus]
MRALLALTRVEWLLFLRNPTMLFMALLLPSGLLLLQAYIIPGTRTPLGQGGLSAMDHLVVLALVVGATSVAITNYPSSVAGYRENGVLRKLDTTPAGPFRLLLAQWIIALISLVAAAGLALAIASV